MCGSENDDTTHDMLLRGPTGPLFIASVLYIIQLFDIAKCESVHVLPTDVMGDTREYIPIRKLHQEIGSVIKEDKSIIQIRNGTNPFPDMALFC
jgi:hypothetical protein